MPNKPDLITKIQDIFASLGLFLVLLVIVTFMPLAFPKLFLFCSMFIIIFSVGYFLNTNINDKIKSIKNPQLQGLHSFIISALLILSFVSFSSSVSTLYLNYLEVKKQIAAENIRLAKEQEKTNKFNSLREQANKKFQKKDYNSAYILYDNSLKYGDLDYEHKKNFSNSILAKGKSLYNSGDLDNATNEMNKSLKFDPGNKETLKYIGLIDVEKESRKAKKDFSDTKEMLIREIKSFNKPFDNSPYRHDLGSNTMENILFGAWVKTAEDAETTGNLELIKLAKNLKSKVSVLQTKEFPDMRFSYYSFLKEKLWIEDIKVKIDNYQGDYDRIEFIHHSFVRNKAISETYDIVYSQLKLMRFKGLCFSWYDGASDSTCYKIDSPKDNETVITKD